jgi:hypothetical protein
MVMHPGPGSDCTLRFGASLFCASLYTGCAAPFSFQDKLLLEEGEKDAAPAGLIPKGAGGLTPAAEIFNSRVAMLGLIALVSTSVATHTPILDTLNAGVGGLLF